MGLLDSLVNSIIAVIAALLGIGLFISGSKYATFGNQTIGTVGVLAGIVLLVFASRV